MISRTAEYALRAMVCLADHPDRSLTTQEIAETGRVPAGYLSRVLQALGRAELVVSQRGLHGGFKLIRPAGRISVLDVVNAVTPIQRIRRCPLGLMSHAPGLCPLHHRIDRAAAMVERAFADCTIGELLTGPRHRGPLCRPRTASRNGKSRRPTRRRPAHRT